MKRHIPLILLVAGCVVLFGFNLGDLSLLKGDENYYFSSARRMIREGDWITPRYHHHIRYEKPILYYWLVALFLKLLGTSWASARMTSLLFGTLTVILTYLLGLRFFKKKTAYLSSVMLATSFLFFRYSRVAVTDITFLFFITLSLYLFVKGEKDKKRIFFLLSYVPLGLSVMTKGPLGLAVAGVIILMYIIITKKYRLLKEMNLALGISIVLLISLPWPLLMYKIHGYEYLNQIWEVETVDKAVGSILKLPDVTNLPWFAIKYLGYYIPVVIIAFVPWSLFLPFYLFKKTGADKAEGRVFILSWFWAVFLFFTFASFKHTHYMLLLSPPLAMAAAGFLSSKEVLQKIAVVSAVITIIIYLSLTGFILPALEDGALKASSLAISSEIKMDEEIGIASKNFNLKKLGIYLNNLVSTPYELGGDDLAQYKSIKKDEVVAFLTSKERVFCLITKRDYDDFVPKELQARLYMLEESLTWKRFDFKESLLSILNKDWEGLKQEAYLITNRRR